jgi:heat-inducible transcriptional repressor
VDLDDVVGRTVRLLAQLTRQVAVVQYPSLTRSVVRHVELLPVLPTRIMLVLITTTGRVEQRVVDTGTPVGEDTLGDLRSRLNSLVVGLPLADVPIAVASLAQSFTAEDRPAVTALLATLLETLVEEREERIVLAGTANLTRFGIDFPDSVAPVLEALEEQMVLLRLLGEVTDPSQVTVRIGHEHHVEGLGGTSVVSVGYGRSDHAIAKLGVLGPTRMDYPATMGAVRAVARYVGRMISEA